MASSSLQPNTTLYINNLNDKVNKAELRSQLFALFTTYGKVIDVIASKSPSKRGQAFLVFTDLAGATSAMRACEGMLFYDKPLVRPCRVECMSEGRAKSPIHIAHQLCQNQILRDSEKGGPQLRPANFGQRERNRSNERKGFHGEAATGT
jgi:RNA recognition motif-containing protein